MAANENCDMHEGYLCKAIDSIIEDSLRICEHAGLDAQCSCIENFSSDDENKSRKRRLDDAVECDVKKACIQPSKVENYTLRACYILPRFSDFYDGATIKLFNGNRYVAGTYGWEPFSNCVSRPPFSDCEPGDVCKIDSGEKFVRGIQCWEPFECCEEIPPFFNCEVGDVCRRIRGGIFTRGNYCWESLSLCNDVPPFKNCMLGDRCRLINGEVFFRGPIAWTRSNIDGVDLFDAARYDVSSILAREHTPIFSSDDEDSGNENSDDEDSDDDESSKWSIETQSRALPACGSPECLYRGYHRSSCDEELQYRPKSYSPISESDEDPPSYAAWKASLPPPSKAHMIVPGEKVIWERDSPQSPTPECDENNEQTSSCDVHINDDQINFFWNC